jgi:hypothetical protein
MGVKKELRGLALDDIDLSVGRLIWAGSDSATEVEAKQNILLSRVGNLPWRTERVTPRGGRSFR